MCASMINDLCDEAFYRCQVEENNKEDKAANIVNEVKKV